MAQPQHVPGDLEPGGVREHQRAHLRDVRQLRIVAQTAADRARQGNLAARDRADATSSSPAAVRDPARAALSASAVRLQAAAAALAALTAQPGPGTSIDVDVGGDGRTVIVRPHGELDMLSCPYLEQVALAQVDGHRYDRLVVDLSQVSFLDSSALAVLVELHRVTGEHRMQFAVSGATDERRRLFTITRLDEVLDIG